MPDKSSERPFRKKADDVLQRAESRARTEPAHAVALARIARVYMALDRTDVLRERSEKRTVQYVRTLYGSHEPRESQEQTSPETSDFVQENTSSGVGGSLLTPSEVEGQLRA